MIVVVMIIQLIWYFFLQETYEDDSLSEPTEHGEEQVDIWQKLVAELKHERDQSIMDRDQSILDRNKAISALMDLEKEHAKALALIYQLRKDLAEKNNIEGVRMQSENNESSPITNGTKADSTKQALSTCEKCCMGRPTFDYIKEDRERIWRDIVKRVTLERDEARKRLEVGYDNYGEDNDDVVVMVMIFNW